MTFYAVPKVMNDQIVQNMSPRNIFYFKKSHKPLFLPTHDMMKGLILGSRMTLIPEENQLSFESVNEAKQYWIKNRRKFKFQHQCKIANKTTTLGRAILSDYFGKDIDAYLSDIKADGLNAKNIVVLYSMLEDFEDRPDRILKIQEFALQVSTLSGSTALTVDQMYFGFDNIHLDEIKSVMSNDMLSHNEKEVKVREIYSDYAKEMTNKLITSRPEVKTALEDTARAKVDQWTDMAFVTLNIDTTGDFHVGTSTIANGMNPTDYTHLAIENRATQDIKTAATPESGYTTRQFVFLATNYSFSAGEDTKNKGILIPECDALGRTRMDGSIVEKSNSKDLIRVRSIIGSTLKDQFAVTKDMLPRMFKYADGARVGMSMMSSLTEQLTQAGLVA